MQSLFVILNTGPCGRFCFFMRCSCDLERGQYQKQKKRPCFRKVFFGWMTGLEPATSRITIWDSNQLSYIHHVARPNIKKPSQISRDGDNFFLKNLFLGANRYFFCMIRRKLARLKSFLCSMQKRGYTYCFGKMRIVNVLLQPSRQHLNSKSMASV